MIILFQPPRSWGIQNMSPFCVKLETYFRMVNIEYSIKPPNFLKAPKGKVPYIKIDDQFIGDSTLIIKELKQRFGDPLDMDLSDVERAQSVALQRLFEDHIYFCGAYLRWLEPTSWNYVKKEIEKNFPPLLRKLFTRIIRKKFLEQMYQQGIGRHSPDDIVLFLKEDIKALSILLGAKPFFLGDKPRTIDATAYGFMVQQLNVPWESELKEYTKSFKNLVEYSKRMQALYWADIPNLGE